VRSDSVSEYWVGNARLAYTTAGNHWEVAGWVKNFADGHTRSRDWICRAWASNSSSMAFGERMERLSTIAGESR